MRFNVISLHFILIDFIIFVKLTIKCPWCLCRGLDRKKNPRKAVPCDRYRLSGVCRFSNEPEEFLGWRQLTYSRLFLRRNIYSFIYNFPEIERYKCSIGFPIFGIRKHRLAIQIFSPTKKYHQ